MKKLDYFTIIAFLFCIFLFGYSTVSNSNLSYFFSIDAFNITIIGSFAAMILTFSFEKSINALKNFKILFFKESDNNAKLVHDIVQVSKGIRKNGLISIENYIDKTNDAILKKGLILISLNQSASRIRKIIKSDMEEEINKYETSSYFFRKWAGYAPAFGMLGTIIGMIQMFNNLDSFASLADGFGKAFLTTFYGLLFANLIFTPIATKLERRSVADENKNKIILEGIIGLKENTNNKILKETLTPYLSKNEIDMLAKMKDTIHLVA